ncbi:NADP-dependent oxidoreductase [Hyalangium sp.]|uniref:NADP-dependent oxidoreductase n=1 Tax=Hyalangium sp. TaxID=2028555 RepID=UPI002D3C817F|nr:NADP-dependent oxidoreductase [Hyalangium sp.]HYH98908.1 NADP-dependent oxidoreductase [Hyalangium sp.]
MPEGTVTSRQVVLARYIQGLPTPEDFRLETVELPLPGAGELRVRTLYATVDPGTLTRLGGRASYAPPLAVGDVIAGAVVGEVVDSRSERFAPGERVVGSWGWREAAVVEARGLRKVVAGPEPVSAELGVFGIPGLTAYFGILELGRPRAGETVLVSSAAGAVGSVAGQVALQQGARVVGIAGGPAKCRWLVEELGFDVALDHRAESDLAAAIRRVCPEGVGVFLDNVGGAVLDAAIPSMALRGRVVLSGVVSEYGVPPEQRSGLKNTGHFITHRLRMEGFVVFDYAERFTEARAALGRWIQEGKLRYREHVVEGLEAAPAAFAGLFRGENFGRMLVRVSPPETRGA